ncbi:MAG: GDSL-type esterase/lipase family protein [Pseudooceanicola sp.]
MIRFLIVFIVAASVGWVGGHYGDRIYKRLVSLRYGHSEFSGLSIARANKLDHHKSIPTRSGIVLVYGDSMIEFADLAELTGDARFINRGIRGDSIAGLTERINLDAINAAASTVVMIGINDLIANRTEKKLSKLVAGLAEKLCSVRKPVHWLAVLPVNPHKFRREIQTRMPDVHMPTPADVKRLNWMIAERSRCEGVTFHDYGGAFRDGEGNLGADMTIDGLHLSAKGLEVLAAQILPTGSR